MMASYGGFQQIVHQLVFNGANIDQMTVVFFIQSFYNMNYDSTIL